MISMKQLLLLTIVSSGLPFVALADHLTFGGVVNGVTWQGPENVYVTPYTAMVNSTSGGSPLTANTSIEVYCLDWNHNINFGQPWDADVFSIDPITAANEANLYYTAANTNHTAYQLDASNSTQDQLDAVSGLNQLAMYKRYLEAAWLFDQMRLLHLDTGAGNTALNQAKQRELNVATWTLFLDVDPPINGALVTSAPSFAADINNTSTSSSSATFARNVYNDLQCAIAHVTGVAGGGCTSTGNTNTFGGDFAASGWYAITPDPKSGGNLTQEFMTYIPPVPEPSTWVLFATVVGILAWSRKRRQQSV
jgi:PEP-CTERM motif